MLSVSGILAEIKEEPDKDLTKLKILLDLDFLVILDEFLTKVNRGYGPSVLSFYYRNLSLIFLRCALLEIGRRT
jgi:hypothetical protein